MATLRFFFEHLAPKLAYLRQKSPKYTSSKPKRRICQADEVQYALTRREAVYQKELEQEILSVIDRKTDEFASIAQNVITSAAKKMAEGSNAGTAIAVADVGVSVAKGVSEINALKSYLLSGIHEKSARVAANLPGLEGLLESSIHGINGSKAHVVRTVLESRGVISGSGNVTHLQVDLDKFGFVPGLSAVQTVSRRGEEWQDVSHPGTLLSHPADFHSHPEQTAPCHPELVSGSRVVESTATSTNVTNRSVVRADEKDVTITPFVFEELNQASQRTTSVSDTSPIRESGAGANTTEFGEAEKHRGQIYEVLSKVDAVNRAEHNYDAQIDHMASHISDIVGDRMRGMMSSGIIRPITAPIVQKTADTMVKWSADWIKSYAEKVSTEVDNRRSEFGDATTGVAASSDDASVLDKVEGKLVELGADVYDAVTGKGVSDGSNQLQDGAESDAVYMDEITQEGEFFARDELEEIEEGGDYVGDAQAGSLLPRAVEFSSQSAMVEKSPASMLDDELRAAIQEINDNNSVLKPHFLFSDREKAIINEDRKRTFSNKDYKPGIKAIHDGILDIAVPEPAKPVINTFLDQDKKFEVDLASLLTGGSKKLAEKTFSKLATKELANKQTEQATKNTLKAPKNELPTSAAELDKYIKAGKPGYKTSEEGNFKHEASNSSHLVTNSSDNIKIHTRSLNTKIIFEGNGAKPPIDQINKYNTGLPGYPAKYRSGIVINFDDRNGARDYVKKTFHDNPKAAQLVNKFFKSASTGNLEGTNIPKYDYFKARQMPDGGYVFEYEAKSDNKGYLKRFILIIDNKGSEVSKRKETIIKETGTIDNLKIPTKKDNT